MKYKLILILFMLGLSLGAFAQKTKKVVDKSSEGNLTETYHVLKSDKDIRHRDYEHSMSETILAKGQYTNNVRSGIWEFYDRTGTVIQRYDFDKDLMLFDKSLGANTDYTRNRNAVPIGGISFLYRTVGMHMRYPAEARQVKAEGKVYLKLTISNTGSLKSVEVLKGFNESCNHEAIRVVNKITEWFPALDSKGDPIEASVQLPLIFQLR